MATASDIFISYVAADREVAKVLFDDYTAYGYKVWWDRELIAGQGYAEKIDQELRISKAVIVLWSADSLKSRWVAGEAETAAAMNKLIPVLLDGTLPENLPSAGLRAVQSIRHKDKAGLQKALDAVLERPEIASGIGSQLHRLVSRNIRRLRRVLSPIRLVILVALLGLIIQTARDVQHWETMDGSMAAIDYERYLDRHNPYLSTLFASN